MRKSPKYTVMPKQALVAKQNQTITPEQAIAELKEKFPADTTEQKVEPKPVKEKKPSVVVERVTFLTPLIESGQHTQPELVETMIKQFGVTKSTAQTFLTDSKNAKYNKFPRLVVSNAEGKLSFK